MPRKRQSPQNSIVATINSQLKAKGGIMVSKKAVRRVGRPTKVKTIDLEDVTILPVANGYLVTSTTTGKNMFVFEDIDKAFDFVRGALKPTAEQDLMLKGI